MRTTLISLCVLLLCAGAILSAQQPPIEGRGRAGRLGRAIAVPAPPVQPAPEVRNCDEARAASRTEGLSLATPTRIDFEDFETRGRGEGSQVVLTTQYKDRGVTFNSPVVLDYTKAIAIPDFARSPSRAIQQCYAAEFCSAPIEMRFSVPQAKVQVWMGYAGVLPKAGAVWLEALDAAGSLIDRCGVILQASRTPQRIALPLELTTLTDRIAVARLVAPELGIVDVAMDDLAFQQVAPPPAPPESAAPLPSPAQPVPGDNRRPPVNEPRRPQTPRPPPRDDSTMVVVIGVVIVAGVVLLVARAVSKRRRQNRRPPPRSNPISVHPRLDAGLQTIRQHSRGAAIELRVRPVPDTPSIHLEIRSHAS